MNLFVNKRQRIDNDRIIIIKRMTPGRGQILVKEGQEVTPGQILGQGNVSGGFRSIRLAQLLSVPPLEAIKYLHRPIGQKIYKGELLAYKKGGLLSGEKVIIAPSDGVIRTYDDKAGNLKIEFLQHRSDLAAAVYGIVEKVDKLRGEVLIKTQATIVYGLMGSGQSREGLLHFLGGRSILVTKESIDKDLAGAIVVAGGLIYDSALIQSVNFGVHGIITGGINAIDFRGVSGGEIISTSKLGTDVGLSLLVSEGFGSIPIGEDIYKVLIAHQNKFAILDGNRKMLILPSFESSTMGKVRKTALPLDLQTEVVAEPEALELKRDLQVRVVSTPYFGEQGLVTDIDQTPTKLESGIQTYLVTIATRTRKIRVPYTNVEAI